MARKVDRITLEVVQNALGALVDEMALTVMRTAYSGVVKDALDYSTAFCDRHGEMIAQGLTIVAHLGSFPSAVRSVLTGYAGRIYPGDMFILNDPYGSGGIHLPDIYVIKPVFVARSLEGFSCVVAHHTDVGGLVPGSNSTSSREIFQEGINIPTLKLYERGVPNEAIFAILEKNVRVPDKVLGDLRAEITAAIIGEREYLRMVGRYGAHNLRTIASELLDLSERMARSEIRALPNGTYEFTDYIDADGVLQEPVALKVAVIVEDERVIVDFAGSSPQVRAGINSPLAFTESAARGAVRMVLDPGIPNSAGYFRCIDVRAPEASVVNPRSPAPCGARGITGFRIVDAVLGALAQAVPARVPADGEGGNTIVSIGGYNTRYEPFVYVDLIAGSRGGAPWGDGPEGVPHPNANIANTPVEVVEVGLPIRIEEYGLLPDSGGAGEHRGALAQVRQLRLLAEDAVLEIRSDKRSHPPYGLQAGSQGTPSANILNPGPGERLLPTLAGTTLRCGDVLRHVMAGGAGWGDPLQRDPELVRQDVRAEKLTREYAEPEYGVVVDASATSVDSIATERRREILRAGRRSEPA